MTAILTFRFEDGSHSFLSNFYPSPIKDTHFEYATVEHYFAANKTLNISEREKIVNASTPGKAKRLGRELVLRDDWEAVKYDVMRTAISLKFELNSDLSKALLNTEDHYLVEGNTWGDKTWGQVNGVGSNWLGIILMARRTELRHLVNSEQTWQFSAG